MSLKNAAATSYKTALRATAMVFKNDPLILKSARDQIRQGFEKNRHLSSQETIQEELKKLDEVSNFLVRNLVQAIKEADTNKYIVEIDDRIELGDNESIKKNSKKTLGSLAGVTATKRAT